MLIESEPRKHKKIQNILQKKRIQIFTMIDDFLSFSMLLMLLESDSRWIKHHNHHKNTEIYQKLHSEQLWALEKER